MFSSDFRQNRLLASLPSEEYEQLLPHLEFVDLEFKQVLYDQNQSIALVYFVLSGVVSLVTIMQNGAIVEVATIGNEGFIGLPIFLGANQIPGQAFAQVPGAAVRMKTEVFQAKVIQGTVLFDLLQRYTQALFNQVAQSAACNRIHSIEERFCRWVLMTHDRVHDDQFPMTHEFLGQMLGVRRASVSEVAATIQNAGLIQYRYGKMTVLDREGLESSACECYGIINREYDRLIGSG